MALKLWSKLDSAGDVTSPQLGTGGAEVGAPTYLAAKFNNGILSDIDNEGCTFPTAGNSINNDKGTIEFWAKMNFAPDDLDYHGFFDFHDSLQGGIMFRFHPAVDTFVVYIYVGGSSVVSIIAAGVTWNIGDLLHLGVPWDRAGNDLGGGKTVAIYVNGVEKASSTTLWNADTVNANLYLGLEESGLRHADAVIDNIKTYDEVKTDFSDRETEGINVAPTAPTSLQVEGKISPIGADCILSIEPEFSAIYNDPDTGDLSNAIQIQAGSIEGLSDKWDSDWLSDSTVEGNRCSNKMYDGAALNKGSSYFWRCRFRDDDDEGGDWSSWQKFEICAVEVEEEPGGSIPYSLPYRRPFLKPKREPK